jgi:hypothetical protein
MARQLARLGGWLLACVPACGGNVEGGGSPEPDLGSDQPAQGKAGSGSALPGADTELGPCTLGPREAFDQPCAWVADDRCYASREMACNCTCPRDRDSQCVSGFGVGPDSHTLVSCH